MEQPIERTYTYADLLSWDDGNRYEIIYGDLYMMAPPSRVHRDIQGEFHRQVSNFLIDKPCRIYMELGVRLFDEVDDQIENSETLVIPDIAVVCDRSKLDDAGCHGAPDLVIEILSPSSISRDRFVKLNLYQQAGVREYWIVDPANRSVEVLLLDEDGRFRHAGAYSLNEDENTKVQVTVLPGCEIELSRVFPEIEVPKS